MSRKQWGHGYHKGFSEGIKTKVSFKEYVVTKYDGHDSLIGDLASDMKRDKTWPDDSQDIKRIMKHLDSYGACAEAKETMKQAWNEWKEIMK